LSFPSNSVHIVLPSCFNWETAKEPFQSKSCCRCLLQTQKVEASH